MPQGHLAILGALLGVACAADVAQRRIPNPVAGLIALAGLAAQWTVAGAWGTLAGGAAGALAFTVLFVPWRLGVVGGGDLKLAAAVAVWIGLPQLLTFALFTGAAGLPVALATRAAHRLGRRRPVEAPAPAGGAAAVLTRPETVPVAVAIALGALTTSFWGATWRL